MADDKLKDNETIEHKELTPQEWIRSLVENHKEDEDFIINAQKVITSLDGNQTSSRVTALEQENKELRQKFFDTFMNGTVPKESQVEEDTNQDSTLSLDELLKNL